jgi:hypothetical protein
MRESSASGILFGLLLAGLALAGPCLAADEGMQLKPRALRPGDTLSVTPGVRLDASKKVFVRLLGPSQIDDLPVDASQVSRGRLRVVLPKQMRQGRYEAQLVTEVGEVLDKGATLKILATETPTITQIVPHPSYAVNGTYTFELLGENFGNAADENLVRINGVPVHFEKYVNDRGRRATVADCQEKFPCLVGTRRRLQVFGLSLEKQPFFRPMNVSVQVDTLTSGEQPLLLSWVSRSTPAVIAFGALGILSLIVYLLAREKAKSYRSVRKWYDPIAYLFIEPDSNTYSLSRLQLILWTAAAIVAYIYLAASQSLVQWKWQLADVPEGLPTLLGLSVGTTALAIGATGARGSKGAGPIHPGFGDFITTGGVLAPERLQFFLWTVIGVFGFVTATLAQDPATVTQLPKVPDNFLPLMGVSAGGYLAGKFVRKPGPVIKQLDPSPPYPTGAPLPAGIRIVGANLSPLAQVAVNGVPVTSGDVTVPPPQSAAAEFVTELVVTPAAAARAVAASPAPTAGAAAPAAPGAGAVTGVPSVKVVNPDGQSADL